MNNRIVSLLTVLLCTSVISASEGKAAGKKVQKALMQEARPDKSTIQIERARQADKKESHSDGRYSKSMYQKASVRFAEYSSTIDLPWPAKNTIKNKDSQ